MNLLDIAVLGIVLLSALLAFSRGFVRELLLVLAWVAAAFATLYLFPYAQPIARDLIPIDEAADLGAALVIFLVTLILASILSGWLARHIHETDFKPLDRSLGFVFGALRGLVLLSLAYVVLILVRSPEDHPSWVREAKSLPVIACGAGLLTRLVPDDFLKGSNVDVNKVRERTKQAAAVEPALRCLPAAKKTAGRSGGSTSAGKTAPGKGKGPAGKSSSKGTK